MRSIAMSTTVCVCVCLCVCVCVCVFCVCVCTRVCVFTCSHGYLQNHITDLTNFMHVPVASFGGIAILYVFPVSWTTLYLPMMGHIAYFNTGAESDVYANVYFEPIDI